MGPPQARQLAGGRQAAEWVVGIGAGPIQVIAMFRRFSNLGVFEHRCLDQGSMT